MRILWLSMTPGLLHEGQGTGNYGGSGWIGALQHLFCNAHTKDKLALAFISDSDKEKVEKNGVLYYPIYEKPENSFFFITIRIMELDHYSPAPFFFKTRCI